MIGAELICSDEACAEIAETSVAFAEQLDLLVCDGCGCDLQVLAVWEVLEVHPSFRRSLPMAA